MYPEDQLPKGNFGETSYCLLIWFTALAQTIHKTIKETKMCQEKWGLSIHSRFFFVKLLKLAQDQLASSCYCRNTPLLFHLTIKTACACFHLPAGSNDLLKTCYCVSVTSLSLQS